MTKPLKYTFTDAGGWFDALRVGDWPKSQDGHHALQVTTAEDLAAIVAQWEAEGKPEFLLDSDHFSYSEAHDTRALGWGTGLRVKDGVLQAQARWSAEGQRDLDNGSYRFCSVSVHCLDEPDQPEDAGKSKETPLRTHPFRLDSIALTNRPNIPGLRPLTNRGTAAPQPTSQPIKRMDHKAIAALAGLPDTATDAEIAAAVTTLRNRSQAAEEAAADAEIARFSAVITDTTKTYWRGQLLNNRAAVVPVLESMLAAHKPAQQAAGAAAGGFTATPVHNRGDVTPPPPGSQNAGAAQEPTEGEKMAKQNSAIALVLNSNRGISNADAFNIARMQHPELFK